MGEYVSYAKKRKFILLGIVACLVLLSISEQFLFAHITTQWSRDREIGVFHIIVGVVAGLLGISGIVLLIKKKMQASGRVSSKWVVKMIFCYIWIQLLAALFQGLISEGLGRFTPLDYETVKTVIYWLVGLIQTLVRVMAVYIILISYYKLKFKEHQKLLHRGLLIGLVFYALLFVLRITLPGIALQISQILWEIGVIVFFIIYFGKNMREQLKDEKSR